MSKIVILGSSIAGFKAAQLIREKNKEFNITLICVEGLNPYDCEKFPDFILKEKVLSDVFCAQKNFYEKNNIIVEDKLVTRINLNKKKIFTENKEQIEYDILILCDLPDHRLPDIKGKTKTGIFGFRRLNDIQEIIKQLPLIETVCIQANSLFGLKLAVAIKNSEKEVSLICPPDSIFDCVLTEDISLWLEEYFFNIGIKIIKSNEIVELLGDSDVKAVRLTSGKVIEGQMVLFDKTFPDFRIFSESDLKMNEKICVDEHLATSIENVYALGYLCENQNVIQNDMLFNSEYLERQGSLVASKLTGVQLLEEPVIVNSLNFNNLSIFFIGNAVIKSGRNRKSFFNKEKNTYISLFIEKDIVVGSVLINLPDMKERIIKLIKQKQGESQIRDIFPESNILPDLAQGLSAGCN